MNKVYTIMGYLAIAVTISIFFFFIIGCSSSDLSVRPSKTTVTYGQSDTENDTAKDAKNDSTTTSDSQKKSWTVKQEFVWGRNK